MNYLTDLAFLEALHSMKHEIVYCRIQILNPYDGWYDGMYIEGEVTGGNINISKQSAMRRTGSLSMIASNNSKNITKADNLISINKRIKVEQGLRNLINPNYPDICWFNLGHYVITGASISHNVSNVSISLNLKDYMALLNGECGGKIQDPTTHSPILLDDGSKEYPLLRDLAKTVVETYGGIKVKDEYIEIPATITNSVRWIDQKPGFLKKTGSINNKNFYSLLLTQPEGESEEISYNETIGYQIVPFTTLEREDITTGAGGVVTEVLDKIKAMLGYYEYYFDTDGEFHFAPVDDGALRGSEELNLSEAINDKYLKQYDENRIPSIRFTDANLIASYNNQPQYNQIKNDIVVWGTRGDNKAMALRYHLIIDKKPIYDNPFTGVSFNTDEYDVKRAYKDVANTAPIEVKDWRQGLYLDYIINGNEQPFSKELVEELPKIMDVESGEFYAAGSDAEKWMNSLNYFFDYLDPDQVQDPRIQSLSVDKIGRRGTATQSDQINCIFEASTPDIFFILLGQENTDDLRNYCLKEGKSFTQIPQGLQNRLALGSIKNAAFDNIRSTLHTLTSYNESISISAMPLYYLDVAERIYIYDDESDIDGNYMINSISLPLTYNGMMNINASRAIERL